MTASYGLMTYLAWPEYNAGDYIQSLAAAQYLPRVDRYINREKLNEYKGERLKMIMNGWFMHHPECWPPSTQILPLVTSFHVNAEAKDKMLDREGVEWFKRNEPVGCRDPYTVNVLNTHGINTYHSGCLTTTFNNTYNYKTNDIYFVDVLFRVPGWNTSTRTPREFLKSIFYGDVWKMNKRTRLLNKLFDPELLENAKSISHYHPARHTERERFEVARNFLEKYATAKLVVTSRLHCALPCLAFGTPVIFIHYGFTKDYDTCRLSGITDLFNTIFIDENERVSANFSITGLIDERFSLPNPDKFKQFVPTLREVCNNFVKRVHEPV